MRSFHPGAIACPKKADPTDKHVGSRVRMRRLMLDLSQTRWPTRSASPSSRCKNTRKEVIGLAPAATADFGIPPGAGSVLFRGSSGPVRRIKGKGRLLCLLIVPRVCCAQMASRSSRPIRRSNAEIFASPSLSLSRISPARIQNSCRQPLRISCFSRRSSKEPKVGSVIDCLTRKGLYMATADRTSNSEIGHIIEVRLEGLTLRVADVRQSIEFYGDKLGFAVEIDKAPHAR